MSPETYRQTSEQSKRSRRHRHRSAFKKWLDRIRTSRTAKKKFYNQLFLLALALAALAFGLYALGPIVSYSPRK